VHLAEITARELGLSEARTARVRFAAMVCRAGRDQISPEILNKRGPLTQHEWIEVRRQPELAAALLSDVSLNDIREWILCHRERPDGRGYPRALSGARIPLEARILAVTDAYTAMVSERPHRARRDHREACLELTRCAGTEFDADVVEAFLRASWQGDELLERMAA
jgi:HD-GYP domain-containing protein (c-di-GMP phosphodiesterase class II)